jgi:thiosulfate/3-mercaptopyruvate sulfurtransferase
VRDPSHNPLYSADDLAAQLDFVLIDFRWHLDDAAKGRRAYEEGHIPGAVFVDLAEVTGSSGPGRHPLPERERFERAMRKAGVGRRTRVVVYDDAGGSVAARLWWLLRIHGHSEVFVLDGGIQAWEGEVETGIAAHDPGDFVAREADLSSILTYDEVAKLGEEIVVLDVRAPERYRGEVEPVDPVAGHIPGAKNAFWQETVMDEGTFASPETLRARLEALGVEDGKVVVYCGSGVVACQTLLALERADIRGARVYSGGWSDWSTRDDAPVATGDQ